MNVMDPLQEVSSTITEENEVFIEIEVGQSHNGISLAEAANALITLQVPSKDPPSQPVPVSSSGNLEKEVAKVEPVAEVNTKDFRKKILEGMKSQFNTSTEEDGIVSTEHINRRGPHRSKSKFKRGNLDEDDVPETSFKIEARSPRGRGRPPKLSQPEAKNPLAETKVEHDSSKTEQDSSSETSSERSDSASGNTCSRNAMITRRSQRTNISRTSATELLKGITERQASKKRPSSSQYMQKPTDLPRKRGRPSRASTAPVEDLTKEEHSDVSCETKADSIICHAVSERDSPTENLEIPSNSISSNHSVATPDESKKSLKVTVPGSVEEVSKMEHMASLGLQSRANASDLTGSVEPNRKKSKTAGKEIQKSCPGARKAITTLHVEESVTNCLDDSSTFLSNLSQSRLNESSSASEHSTTESPDQDQEPKTNQESPTPSANTEASAHDELPQENTLVSARTVNGHLNSGNSEEPTYSCACVELRLPVAVAPPAATLYCQAVDSVGGKLVGCCLIANHKRFHRPSKKIPFMILCDSHRDRIRKHFCCPGCGLFCTQGTFLQCHSVEGSLHFFHAHCQRVSQRSVSCLHCNRDDHISEIRLQMKTCAVPVFCNDAKLLKTMPTAKITLLPRESLGSSTSLSSSSKSASPCPNYIASQLVLPSGKVINSSGIPKALNREILERILKSLDNKSRGSASNTKNLYTACKNGDIERVVDCLRSGQDVNSVFTEADGQTALHAACYGGNLAIIHVIVQSGAALDKMDRSQKTALITALIQGHNDVVKYLLQAGASASLKGEGGMTALHVAAKHGNLEGCHYIMTLGQGGKFINGQDDGGWTPLVWGCEHQRYQIVKYLLQCKADPSVRDAEQNVALHWAAYSGSVDIVALLLDNGCQVNVANVHGDTPLHTAGRRDNYECVLLLVTRGGRLDLRNKEGHLAIEVCPNKQCHSALLLALNTKLQRLTQASSSTRIEKLLLNDITKGKESSPIQCVNGCDDEPPPDDYVYITENCFTSPLHIERTITSLQYCQCLGDCSSQNCKCSALSYRCWYDDEGKLVPEFNFADPPMLFECNRACQCHKTTCNNRLVQHGITARLVLFRVDSKGWGVRTSQPITKGSYVCEYIGEIISDFEADQREDDSYLFDLDNKDGETYCIDARRYGNIARFINHSCDPNLIPVKVYIDHQDLKFPRIAFFAVRDIDIDEELSFDYGDKFWIIKYKSFTCSCFSAKCKYSQLTIHRTVEEYRRCLQEGYFPT